MSDNGLSLVKTVLVLCLTRVKEIHRVVEM